MIKSISFNVQRLLPYLALVAVGACGGSGGSGGSGSSSRVDPLEQMNARAVAFIQSKQPTVFTGMERVPTMGNVDYSGFLLVRLSNTSDTITDTISGEMHVQVDFDQAAMVTGSTGTLLDDRGKELDGQIMFSAGSLDREGDPNSNATFEFSGSGILIDDIGQAIDLELAFEGDFLEQEATAIGGAVLGRSTTESIAQTVGGVFMVGIDQ